LSTLHEEDKVKKHKPCQNYNYNDEILNILAPRLKEE